METNYKWIWREFKRNYFSKKRREDRFKKDSRTDKSIITTEELININPPASNARAYMPYQCNKKKHFMLYIWKHETGIKINFDLWKP